MRRLIGVLMALAVFVVVTAPAAWAQPYPPDPSVAPVTGAPGVRGTLPRTGSSDTPSLILIGLAALVVGLVLVVATMRRRRAAVSRA